MADLNVSSEADIRAPGPSLRRVASVALACVMALLVVVSLTSQASAAEAIDSFEVDTSTTQAGGHPDIHASLRLESPGDPEAAKNVIVNLPEGVFGNPNAITQCTALDFAQTQCPSSSQAGLVTVYANYLGDPEFLLGTAPVFDMEPQNPDQTARFAFIVPILGIPINVPLAVRTGSDFGLRLTFSGVTPETPFAGADLTLWGFPAEFRHNVERFAKGSPGAPAGCPEEATPECILSPTRAGIAIHPLTDNPTVCTGQPLKVSIAVETYQDPGNPSTAAADYPATTGCEKEAFTPVLHASATSAEADSPSGLDLEMDAPQSLGPAAAPSQIRSVTVTLPEGFTINPDAADGQTACPDALANFGTELASRCPDTSKIGTFAIGTEALAGPLVGALYFGEPKPGDQYRLILSADGFGIHAKLIGSVKPDPETGQLTATFIDLPQVPFDSFDLHLFASDRGLIATPTHCSSYQVDSEFVPWNDRLAPQRSQPALVISSGPDGAPCPGTIRPFEPRLFAGTSTAVAGSFSSFTLRLDRDDGDQFLGDLNFRMPPGFTGDLGGLSYCPEGAIQHAANNLGRVERDAASCPADSQIGTTNVAAGPGGHPFNAIGRMYLAGPFEGAPLSLAAVTPALAGPYDYGVVVVRVGLHIDPQTAQVTAVSDTVPKIIGGVPIRMRAIQVNIDKPNFTINPTNCSPFSVDSQGIGDQGTVADFSSYFHAVNCASLAFKPKMSVRLLSRKAAARAKNPALRFDLRTRPGDANLKSLVVSLSHAFEIDQSHLGNICSEKELAASDCTGRTAIGRATTTTPLLDQPLSGPVYAVSGSGGLPRLAFILKGQVDLLPRADTKTTKDGRLKTTVPVVPDAPIGHFRLVVFGGKTGYLGNTRNICKNRPITDVEFIGQNGKERSSRVKLQGCGKAKGKRKHRR